MRLSKKKSCPPVPLQMGESLSPLIEGPVPECEKEGEEDGDGDDDDREGIYSSHGKLSSWVIIKSWMKRSSGLQTNMTMKKRMMMNKKKKKTLNSRVLLLGVLGCPLAPLPAYSSPNPLPLPHLSVKDMCIEASSAQYIVHQYIAATMGGAGAGAGAAKKKKKKPLHSSFSSSYVAGKVRMVASECETGVRAAKIPPKSAEDGWFVLWHMRPEKWYMELALGATTIKAGSNGKLVWRHTPWLGAHAAKGPVRPLRRALQGLDPIATASIFANARCIGEKRIGDEDCFLLKVSADQTTLNDRSDGAAEIIRHVLIGCFSQRTGYLVCLKDSNLTRIQATGSEVVYWETMIESTLKDYRDVDGVALAHGGQSIVTLYRFGEATNHTRTRMEETWSIEEVVFDVPGLSDEFFIPPADISLANSKDSSPLVDGVKAMSIGKVVS